MGTSGLFGFRKNGQRQTSFNSYDSYNLTLDFARFLAQISPAELARLIKMVNEIIWVDGQSSPGPEELELVDIYERYGYNYEYNGVRGLIRGRSFWDDVLYTTEGTAQLFEILDGKLKHLPDKTYYLGLLGWEWGCFIDFELRQVEIWAFSHEFALVSFDGLVEAYHKYEASTERYLLFNTFLKEEFAIGDFGSEYELGEYELQRQNVKEQLDMLSNTSEEEGFAIGDFGSECELEEYEQPTPEINVAPLFSTTACLMSLPTELHLEIIRYLNSDPIETLPALYDDADAKASIQAQWALKRTCRHFWDFPDLIAPSSFFKPRSQLPTVERRHYQRLIIAALAPDACFPCYKCRKFLPLDHLHPSWGGKFYFWEEQYLSCCTTCLSELARDVKGQAINELFYAKRNSTMQDVRRRYFPHQWALERVQCLMSLEVQQKLVEARLLGSAHVFPEADDGN